MGVWLVLVGSQHLRVLFVVYRREPRRAGRGHILCQPRGLLRGGTEADGPGSCRCELPDGPHPYGALPGRHIRTGFRAGTEVWYCTTAGQCGECDVTDRG